MRQYIFVFIISFFVAISSNPVIAQKNNKKQKKDKSKKTEQNISYDINTTAEFIEAVGLKISDQNKALEKFEKYLEEHPNDAAAWHSISEIYSSQHYFDKAREAAEKAVELDDQNIFYLKTLANHLWSIPASDRVLDIYEKITQVEPEDIQAQINYTNALLTTNYHERTIENLQKLKDKIGVNEDINMKLVRLYEQTKSKDKAYAEVNELIEAFPSETKYIGILAEMYMKDGKEEQAIRCYDKMIEVEPDDPYIHLSKAEFFMKKNKPERAYEELKKSFSSPKIDAGAKLNVLMNFYTSEDILVKKDTIAINLLKTISETHPDDPRSLAMLSDVYINNGDIEKARDGYYKALQMDLKSVNVYLTLLSIESSLNNYDSIISLSTAALEYYPLEPYLYFYKGMGESIKGQTNESIKTLENGLNLVVKNQNLSILFYTYLGDAYVKKENKLKGFEYYDKTLELDSVNSYVLNNYSYFISSDKELSKNNSLLSKAAKMAKKAVSIQPDSPHYLDTYGWALFKQQKFDDALSFLIKALEKSDETSKSTIYEHLGDTYWMMHKKDKAIEYWEKAFTEDKNSEILKKKVNNKKYYEE